MFKKSLALFMFFSFITPCIFVPHPGLSSTINKGFPIWWNIKVLLSTEGEYQLKQKGTSYLGDYSFKILWKGSMETDDSDYILFHEESRLIEWKFNEQSVSSKLVQMISEKDFKEKPIFHMNYILRIEKDLHFDFYIDGFYIPQNNSLYKHYLHFPCSSECSTNHPEIKYNSSIAKGSNRIFLNEKEIYDSEVKKCFDWTWKQYVWPSTQDIHGLITNFHNVKIQIFITPHFIKGE